MVSLSILLLTRNGSSDLVRTLPAIFRQQQVPPFEVLAVDSASSDGTVPLLQRFGVRVLQIAPDKFHHSRTRNLAAEQAQGQILIFLSQDAVPTTDLWLSKLTSNFTDPKVGAVYGRQVPKADSMEERRDTFDVVYGDHRIVKDPAHRNGLGYRFYHFSDVNAAIRRDVWQATRFPEDLKVFEDLGIAKRILDDGWKIVYEPDAAVIHSHEHSTVGLFKRYFDIGYTLKKLRIWDAPGTRKSILRDAWQMLRGRMTRNRDEGRTQAGAGIRQHAAKSLGLFLGINQAWLPHSLKRHLSAYRVFG